MIPIDTLLTFAAAAFLLAFVPGPDNLFVLAQSALFGPRVGISVTAGLCAGLVVHTLAVSLGVAAIFQTSQVAFDALKYVGAAYLIFLAYKSFTARADEIGTGRETSKPLMQMFARGIFMNVTNPKVAIFFLAFLPQFANPASESVVMQMLVLGGLFIVCAFISFCIISLLAGSLSSWLRKSPAGQVWLNRAAGVVFVGLALKLATTHR